MADLAQARQSVTSYAGRKIRIMEVCGTHTHEIFRLGIRKLLPPQIELVSGPGCPVCVTPVSFIDEALWPPMNTRRLIRIKKSCFCPSALKRQHRVPVLP